MISALIVDDELPARNRLKRYLNEHPDIRITGVCGDGTEALEAMEKLRPDLVFLDIQMPGMNGFEVLEKLSFVPAVVFVSAYDEYALRAFDVNAIDYLLKPYNKDRLLRAVERALEELLRPKEWKDKLDNLLSGINRSDQFLQRITYRSGQEFQVIDVREVDFFRIEDGRLFLHSGSLRRPVEFTLSNLEKRLNPDYFLRVHRKAIANLGRIRRIQTWGPGRLVLEYRDAGNLQVSRERTAWLKEQLGFK